MPTLLEQVYQLVGIKSLKTTPYHPQTDCLTKPFKQTLKQMLRKVLVLLPSNDSKLLAKWQGPFQIQ